MNRYLGIFTACFIVSVSLIVLAYQPKGFIKKHKFLLSNNVSQSIEQIKYDNYKLSSLKIINPKYDISKINISIANELEKNIIANKLEIEEDLSIKEIECKTQVLEMSGRKVKVCDSVDRTSILKEKLVKSYN
jgi:hypothetical protein